MVRRNVNNQVMALPTAGEVLLGVVDGPVRADRGDQRELLGSVHTGHESPERLGDPEGERADTPAGAVDQDL
jgi:hypothetical protein